MSVPARFGHFNLLKHISDTPLATVYEAYDRQLKRHVTLQILHIDTEEHKEILKKFLRDTRKLADVVHQNVLHILSLGEVNGQVYLVLEMAQGSPVRQLIEFGEPVDELKAMRIGIQVAEGLNAAAKAGVGHGDISPSTILLDKSGQSKVVDFGLARLAELAGQVGIAAGSTFYVAPEIVRGVRSDHRADIYSLAAVLYHLMAGQPPFKGQNAGEVVQARLNQTPPDLGQVNPKISRKVALLISKLMAVDPSERPGDYQQIINTMRAITGITEEQEDDDTPEEEGYALADTPFEMEAPSRAAVRKQPSDEQIAYTASGRPVRLSDSTPGRKRRKKQTSGGLVAVVIIFGLILVGLVGTLIYLAATGKIGEHFQQPIPAEQLEAEDHSSSGSSASPNNVPENPPSETEANPDDKLSAPKTPRSGNEPEMEEEMENQ